MSLVTFRKVFPELAVNEIRFITLEKPFLIGDITVPADEYGFEEFYCVEAGCDCRRVMFVVFARDQQTRVATISHSFEPPESGDDLDEQTYLDPLNPQAKYAAGLMAIFMNVVLADSVYCKRLERHYTLFKAAINDPENPAHYLLQEPNEVEREKDEFDDLKEKYVSWRIRQRLKERKKGRRK